MVKAPSIRTQAVIVVAFLAFQALDIITTHIGLRLSHPELNSVMAPIVGSQGELAAYALKGVAVAVLLGVLMLLQYRRPRVWHAFRIGACLTAMAVSANLYQLLA
ncbi:MAG TPA: DUF5658 family protein [Candidatus Limnocylindria bacterium]|nr:DUF5658 family protein [Candidatus Limnocylindria bacterium]